MLAPGKVEYNVRVPHSTVRTSVPPEPAHSAAAFVVTNDPATALTDSGYGNVPVELAEGSTTMTITVTAEDGNSRQTYVVRIARGRTLP